ncbi:hypothetical protein Tco_0060581 [Tanacetum coccineum]
MNNFGNSSASVPSKALPNDSLKTKSSHNCLLFALLRNKSPAENVVKSVTVERCDAFWEKGKLAPRYVGPFEILERIGPVAYRLRLPEELIGVHDTHFHVSNLKKCLGNANLHVGP